MKRAVLIGVFFCENILDEVLKIMRISVFCLIDHFFKQWEFFDENGMISR